MKFIVDFPGESAAGLNPFTDEIEINIKSGDPGAPEEFTEHMKQALKEYYDGAGVFTEQEYQKMIDEENKLWEDAINES